MIRMSSNLTDLILGNSIGHIEFIDREECKITERKTSHVGSECIALHH